MAFLKVIYKGQNVQTLSLQDDKTYVVGRKEDCDVVLQPEQGISREHFKISLINGNWQVDIVSKYGDLTVNGEKSQSLVLEHGMAFTVPPYEFLYMQEDVNSAEIQNIEASVQESDAEEKTVIGAAPSIPYVKMMDDIGGVKEMFRLQGGTSWVAGREESCQIHIRDQRVSRKQFEIKKVQNQYSILDLGSVNGTFLNGAPISSKDATPLRSGDTISVLDNQLSFELHDPTFGNRLEMIPVNALTPLEPLPPAESYDASLAPYEPASAPISYEPQMTPMPHQAPSSYTPPLHPVQSEGFDFQKHRVKLIAGAILIVALAFYMSEDPTVPPVNTKAGPTVPQAMDPFSQLKPEQQVAVKQSYQLAKNLYMQGKYELAQNEISKILEVIPDYEDVKEIQRLAQEAILIQEQKRKQEEMEQARIETEERIMKKVGECAKLINAKVTMASMENCLSDIMQFNPEHPKILELKQLVEQKVADREAKQVAQAMHSEKVSRLKALYVRAEKLHKQGKPLDAIKAYEGVTQSSLPDPQGLKKTASRNIAEIRAKISAKTAHLRADAVKMEQAGNLKGAILALRKARQIDPNNMDIPDKIEQLVLELKKQMMVLYQEGILEESFGNVDGSESKSGAKDKWKKIIELDIPDGEYYKKAYIKLKKYGTY